MAEQKRRRFVAPKGNRFWEARSSHGRKPKFGRAEDLWNACKEYFEWVEKNPLWEAKAFGYKGEVTIETVPKMRAMTLDGLCLFLDIDYKTWASYRTRRGFIQVVTRTEQAIKEQKFAGAAAELLNPNIIARDLGLVDKKQSDVVVKADPESVSAVDSWLTGIAAGEAPGQNKTTLPH